MTAELPKYRAPSGEFANTDLKTLGDACNALSFDLRMIEQPQGKPEERTELVARADGLLHHAARAITPQPLMPGAPEHRIGDGPDAIQVAFGSWMTRLLRTARYHVLLRAKHAVYGNDAAPAVGSPDVSTSDEATMNALRALDMLRTARRGTQKSPD